MMKIKCKKILWVRLLMYSLVMGIGIFLVRQKWNEQARVIFKTALLQELQKRDTLSISYISNWKATPALEEVNPGTVEIELDSGKRKYEIPCFKFENSLVKGGIQRGLLTALLDESPLDADSLHGTWNKLLKESDIFLKTHTRITVFDFQEQPSSAFSKNVQKFSRTDSLFSYYMGYRCEVEATGYASCEWWWLFSDWRLLAIGGVCAGIELLFFIFGKVYCYRKNRQIEEVEQEGYSDGGRAITCLSVGGAYFFLCGANGIDKTGASSKAYSPNGNFIGNVSSGRRMHSFYVAN